MWFYDEIYKIYSSDNVVRHLNIKVRDAAMEMKRQDCLVSEVLSR